MKLSCVREKLLKSVEVVSRLSGKNLTLPVLNCILLEAKGSSLYLRATNLEVGVEIVVPAHIKQEGVVAVSGQVLVGTIGSLTHDRVELELLDGNLLVKSPSGNTLIKAQGSDDFPVLPQGKDGEKLVLLAEVLVRGVRSVVYSASTSSIKPEQGSVYVFAERNKLYFVATDSFRLAEKYVELKHDVPEFDPILIPIKNVLEIVRLLEMCEGDVSLTVTRNQLSLAFDDVFFTSRLIDGSFPDYRQVIPKEGITEVQVLKQDLITVFKKASLFSGSTNQITFHLNPKGGSCVVEARSPEVGESSDEVRATLKGEMLDIHFNYRYITDCFTALTGDSVLMVFSGLGRPLVMKSIGDATFLYLVMPMNK